ncbi:MAG: glycosyltransferase [Pseudooceanicola sp.]|nr:glycosyltransferase [Pseudooceanicola sp.]
MTVKAPLGEILVAEGFAPAARVQEALAEQFGILSVDPVAIPPTVQLASFRPPDFWLVAKAVPWRRQGRVLFIATARPEEFDDLRQQLANIPLRLVPVLASRDAIETAIAAQSSTTLALAAETRLPLALSSRRWGLTHRLGVVLAVVLSAAWLAISPAVALTALGAAAALATLLFATLRVAALAVWLLTPSPRPVAIPPPKVASGKAQRRPKISILVPLFRETEIAGALVRRLCRLTYPKPLLDVLLVLEAQDNVTRKTLERTVLPPWMRVITVPGYSGLTTKPRAMNYALDFCQGEIIGVWDAEDAPAADQLERVAERFADAPPEVACLQGVLDFYNPRTNWIARCFSIEYSAWFRVIMPALDRLRLVLPLGGTTLFFRRGPLEELFRWDAHNVTEDADLGMRLCRGGWRTEMLDSTTYEEANCRPWPWIKQRSRWLKGFMMTYLVHMASPWRLWRDLGTWRFLSFQAFFIGTVGQFILAPVLWSYWLILLGLPHPSQAVLGDRYFMLAGALIFAVELVSVLVAGIGARRAERGFLIPWVVTMPFYYAMGGIAGLKAITELIVAPQYWDKTQHGVAEAEQSARGRH